MVLPWLMIGVIGEYWGAWGSIRNQPLAKLIKIFVLNGVRFSINVLSTSCYWYETYWWGMYEDPYEDCRFYRMKWTLSLNHPGYRNCFWNTNSTKSLLKNSWLRTWWSIVETLWIIKTARYIRRCKPMVSHRAWRVHVGIALFPGTCPPVRPAVKHLLTTAVGGVFFRKNPDREVPHKEHHKRWPRRGGRRHWRQRTQISNNDTSVINLSDRSLSDDELSVFKKGLSFVPSQKATVFSAL